MTLLSLDPPGKVLSQVLDRFIHGPQACLTRENLPHAVGKDLPLLSGKVQAAKVENNPLAWPFGSANSLHEPLVDVDLPGPVLFFGNFSHEHAMASTMKGRVKSRQGPAILALQNEDFYSAHVLSSTYESKTGDFPHRFTSSPTNLG